MGKRQFHSFIALCLIVSMFSVFGFTGGQKAEASHDLVNPNQFYTYDEMITDMKELAAHYPGLISYKEIGRSEYNRPIYAIKLGKGNANVFVNSSHHAREWITTNLSMDMIDEYATAYTNGDYLGKYNVRDILNKTTMWFVPMVNPDGVTLQQYGLSKFPSADHWKLINMNEGSTDFKRWKANARGVDLNRQYDADWANIKNNTGKPSWSNYKGTAPVNQKESKAIVNFTNQINPEMAVAYHSSGEILYWNFHQTGSWYDRDHAYAKAIGNMTGYRLIYPGSNPSGGGFTDWFIIKYKRPGFTPELGNYAGNTHVPVSEYPAIWSQNKYVGLYVAQEGYKLYVKSPRYKPEQKVTVYLNGKLFSYEKEPFMKNDRTYVPLRGVFEQLGTTVKFNDATQEIKATRWDRTITLKIGSKTATVVSAKGTSTITFDTAPEIIDGHTVVPIRFVADALGAETKWNGTTYTVSITDNYVRYSHIKDPNPVGVTLNGEKQTFDPPAHFYGYDTVYLPLRNLLTAMGATVTYKDHVVTAVKDDQTMVINLELRTVSLNGKYIYFNRPVILDNGTTMLPIRDISEAFGFEVSYSPEERMVYVVTPDAAAAEEAPAEEAPAAEQPAPAAEADAPTEAQTVEEQPQAEEPAAETPEETTPAEEAPAVEEPTEDESAPTEQTTSKESENGQIETQSVPDLVETPLNEEN
ncbi:stalk domain-containing protein [Fictibacillus nanhaiensis]|uniref:stalk domain-containing protein n=1 Tax=Fictibacillus nanhaiensis TaxID=742169 RepID=UPI00203D7CF2|nr:stalk domain-containing protein [Fictibacillus nanhaiensis]MCM3734217.1 stalk domain-containing protein [Fictibacillus nanhaiensis]